MDIREATGADCVWYQEHIQKGQAPNAAEMIARFTSLTEEEALAMPAKAFWPTFKACQDAVSDGFNMDPLP